MLLDTHYHLDFLGKDAPEFLRLLDGITVVAQTVLPSEFAPILGSLPSLGYHPWWIAEDVDKQLELFDAHLPHTRFIGEIGLDFSPRRLEVADAELQKRVLRHILTSVASSEEPRVLSIHAVRSASEVLNMLADIEGNYTAVFHWFSGTSDELTRLIELGGCISVNPRMLESKKGRAYVKQVPPDRLLLESDLPSEREQNAEAQVAELEKALRATLARISDLRGNDATAAIEENQRRLYRI